MLHRKPRLRIEPGSGNDLSHAPSSFTPVAAVEKLDYPHESVFRSQKMQVSIRSPSVKMTRWEGQDANFRALPVYGDNDRVGGTIALTPQVTSTAGRFLVYFEGAFMYISPNVQVHQGTPAPQYRHVFYSSSINFASASETASPLSATLRGAISATVRRHDSRSGKSAIPRKGSLPTMGSAQKRAHSFTFDIPRGERPGEEMPPTFSSSSVSEGGVRGRAYAERAEVSYKIIAIWEPQDESESRDILEIPILFQPDSDFLSLDGLSNEPESWLEIPLRSDRPIPIQCAVTLPSPSHFPRSGAIAYFVVFSTTPKSPSLAREIASDATITVSLFRQVTINPSQAAAPSSISLSSSSRISASSSSSSTPGTPPGSVSEESDSQATSSLYIPRRNKLFTRVVRSAPPILLRTPRPHGDEPPHSTMPPPPPAKDKPLPELPTVITDSRILHTDVSIGFPKRPRQHTDQSGHPSLHSQKSLPDGLYKGKMQLNKGMLPNVNWAGLSIKYYLEVSVLFGQDDMRARVPIRIY
ncbi:hypothetical protein DENSPDRAFT_778464 [Dentipellis sp. KUC8613]|nr:hypothetical protein DENSPDRAFT_778464 [Dentipellis sp. KUC8613]